MNRDTEALREEIDMLCKQDYNVIPNHKMVGRTLRLVKGDPQFFHPDTEKEVQQVKRGSMDSELYYVIYGDGEYHDELFLVPIEHFRDNDSGQEQKKLSTDIDS